MGALFPSLVPGVGSRDHLEQKEGQEVALDPVLHFFVLLRLVVLAIPLLVCHSNVQMNQFE